MSRDEVLEPTSVRNLLPRSSRRLLGVFTRRDGGPGAPPWGFLGMVVLTIAAESRVSKLGAELADFGVRDWGQSRKASDRDLRGYRLLCFGDSQVKTGVVPQVLEARTGWRTHNLALVGGQAPSSYFLLRRALKQGAEPSAIVVDFLPPLLRIDLQNVERNFPELLDLGEVVELAWADRSPVRLLSLAAGILVPSVRSRVGLRNGMKLALEGKTASRRGDTYFRRNWRLNRGAMLLAPRPRVEDAEFWYRMNYPNPWSSHRLNATYVERFLDLAESRGIAVYWLLHPIAPGAQSICEGRGQDERYDGFVREALGRHRNLVVVDGRHSGYRDSEFTDIVHVHAGAASELSEGLADVLRHPPVGADSESRRVVLPRYRERPGAIPVENLSESALALQRIEKKRL